jgi:peptide/nickel transport system ATP-binding protein
MGPKQIDVIDLCVSYAQPEGRGNSVLEGINLAIHAGETVGLLGSSGSGKTTLGLAIAGMLPDASRITGGEIRRPALTSIAEQVTAVIHQEPARALAPYRRVGDQIADVVQSRFGYRRPACRTIVLDGLRSMQFEGPDAIYRAYPHELSGGQRQRIVIAQAFLRKPGLIIADEPTSALDTVTQKHILQGIQQMMQQEPTAMLLISHDPVVLLSLASRIAVLEGGRIVEEKEAYQLWKQADHPYTQRLLSYARLQ